MGSLGHYGEYDEYIDRLVEAMRYKLRINVKKGFLGDVPPDVLLDKLKDEVKELEDAASRGSMIEMLLESADIANFALGFVIAAMKGKGPKPTSSMGTCLECGKVVSFVNGVIPPIRCPKGGSQCQFSISNKDGTICRIPVSAKTDGPKTEPIPETDYP